MYRYCELVDAGSFDELGELMEHCSLRYGEPGTAGPSGAEAIADSYRSMLIIHEDGTPRTRHLTSNPIIEIDGDTARVRSVYTVLQQAGDSPLGVIISGRYHDTLERIDGRWRFTQRRFFGDLFGDLSRHLRFELQPGPDRSDGSQEQP